MRLHAQGYLSLPPRAGHYLESVDQSFDSRFFNMHPKQADAVDPQIRFLLECTAEALQDARIPLDEISGSKTGVYIGACFSDYHSAMLAKPEKISAYTNVGSAISMAANKISFHFNLKGPSFSVDTACSSSMVALHYAMRDLKAGKCDRAIVGGTSLTLRPGVNSAFAKYNMLSPTGTCHSFSQNADGYCRSDGLGVIVLESARVRRRQGYACVLGTGVNSDGGDKRDITFPNPEGQKSVIRQALCDAGVDPTTIEYIEAHGTGTKAGDGSELAALQHVYLAAGRKQPLTIGSVKSNLGHAEGASGILALIKTLLMYETGQIPPNLHLDAKLSPHESVRDGTIRIVTGKPAPWGRGNVSISNFGFGGTNAHVILGRAPAATAVSAAPEAKIATPNECNGLVLSYARCTEDLVRMARVAELMPTNRFRYSFRGVVDRKSNTLVASRRTRALGDNSSGAQGQAPKTCWIFSGQGSNWKGMARDLVAEGKRDDASALAAAFRSSIQKLTELAREVTGGRINLMSEFESGQNWMRKDLSTVGICAVQIAIVDVLRARGYGAPDYIIGHSMGELAAAYAYRDVTARQAMQLCAVRSSLTVLIQPGQALLRVPSGFELPSELARSEKTVDIGQAEDGRVKLYRVSGEALSAYGGPRQFSVVGPESQGVGMMAVVGMTADKVLPYLEAANANVDAKNGHEKVIIACFNAPSGLTLSGNQTRLSGVVDAILKDNPRAFVRALNTDGVAYHSPMLQPYRDIINERMQQVFPGGVALEKGQNKTGKWLRTAVSASKGSRYHTDNIMGPVKFYQAVQQLPPNTVCVEIGPSRGLLSQIKRTRKDLALLGSLYRPPKGSDTTPLQPSAPCLGARQLRALLKQLMLHDLLPAGHPQASGTTACKAPDLSFEERVVYSWDRDTQWEVPDYKAFEGGISETPAGVRRSRHTVTYDIGTTHRFVYDHVIDGRAMFPATGHLWSVWQCLGVDRRVRIWDIRIENPVLLPSIQDVDAELDAGDAGDAGNDAKAQAPGRTKLSEIVFDVRFGGSGDWTIVHQDSGVVARGKAKILDDGPGALADGKRPGKAEASDETGGAIAGNYLYNEFRRYGYEYGKTFRLITSKSSEGSVVRLRVPVHPIPYMDNLLQAFLENPAGLRLPTRLQEAILSPLFVSADGTAAYNPRAAVPKDVLQGLGLDVDIDRARRSVTTVSVRMTGLHTAIAPLRPRPAPVVEPQEFVAFGREVVEGSCREDSKPLQYASQLARALKRGSLEEICTGIVATPDALLKFVQADDEATSALRQELLGLATLESYASAPSDVIGRAVGIVGGEMEVLFSSSDPPSMRILEVASAKSQNVQTTDQVFKAFDYMIAPAKGSYTIARIGSAKATPVGNADPRIATVAIKPASPASDGLVAAPAHLGLAVGCANISTALVYRLIQSVVPGGFVIVSERTSATATLIRALMQLDEKGLLSPNEMSQKMDRAGPGLALQLASLTEATISNTIRDAGAMVVRCEVSGDRVTFLIRRDTDVSDAVVVETWPEVLSALNSGDKSTRIIVNDRGCGGAQGMVKALGKEGYGERICGYTPLPSVARKSRRKYASMRLAVVDRRTGREGAYVRGAPMSPVLQGVGTDVPATWPNYELEVARPGDLSSVRWVQRPQRAVTVAFAALNFKDVMYAFGKLKLEKPSFGFEFSGLNGAGRRVIGFHDTGCFAKSVDLPNLYWTLPKPEQGAPGAAGWTMAQAATIPVVYSTAYYALVMKANLTEGDSVLIHAGSGGVGHAAITICLARGIQVYTTCSAPKRQHLMDRFGLDPRRIGNSRDPDAFYRWILRETGGEGVTCVLNSLSGDTLHKSLTVVQPFGHFCEIGKFDLTDGTKIALDGLQHNVSYHAIDLSTITNYPRAAKKLRTIMQRGIDQGEVRPLPVKVYPGAKVKDALRFLSKGKHIGKIALDMAQRGQTGSTLRMDTKVAKSIQPGDDARIPLQERFSTQGTHVVLGGFGGLGLELARFLAARGAKRVLLVSRSGPKTSWQKSRLALMQRAYPQVSFDAVRANLVDAKQCNAVIESTADADADLAGVWNAAMVLNDCLFKNMTQSRWSAAVRVKQTLTDNLDATTRAWQKKTGRKLQCFVVFSSVSSLFGNAGQTNYAWGNATMETTCNSRAADSLPSLAVQLGALDHVGFIAEKDAKERARMKSLQKRFEPQPIDTTLESMDWLLARACDLKVSVAAVYLPTQKGQNGTKAEGKKLSFRAWLLKLLGVQEKEVAGDKNASLSDLGVDSLQAVEIRNRLGAQHGVTKKSEQVSAMKLAEVWDL